MKPLFDTHCDKCLEPMNEKDGVAAMGYKIELVCECCADYLDVCNGCGRVGTDDAYSYGQEKCDNCCDYEADKQMDND